MKMTSQEIYVTLTAVLLVGVIVTFPVMVAVTMWDFGFAQNVAKAWLLACATLVSSIAYGVVSR